ncbi:MAG: TIGR01212 family radical SAM protein [Acidobacteriota bacterium]
MKNRYNSFSSFLKEKFSGIKVRKIPVNAGFQCPNKNGDISNKGCIFCDAYGSGPIRSFRLSIREQIENYIRKHKGDKFIAYYQAHSNTYAQLGELEEKYRIIFDYEDIVGFFIGTRPDSIKDEVYPLLDRINNKTYLTIELGLQSIHEKSLIFLNRNHTYEKFLETFFKLKKMDVDVLVHLIVGIPGESREDMKATVREMNRIKPAGVKFHLLHALKNTYLNELYGRGEIPLMEMDDYIETIVELVGGLDPDIVIHRLTGERDKEIFVAPQWALNKNKVINSINKRMEELDLFQGKYY